MSGASATRIDHAEAPFGGSLRRRDQPLKRPSIQDFRFSATVRSRRASVPSPSRIQGFRVGAASPWPPRSGRSGIQRAVACSGSEELPNKARFSLVEPFSVEGLFELQALVVHVMTQLMQDCPKERLELDHLSSLRRSHPNRDSVDSILAWFIQTMELACLPGRPAPQHLDTKGRHFQRLGESIHERLCGALGACPVTAVELSLQCVDEIADPIDLVGPGQVDALYLVARTVYSLLVSGQFLVVGEGHACKSILRLSDARLTLKKRSLTIAALTKC